jgi:hypothetical protein
VDGGYFVFGDLHLPSSLKIKNRLPFTDMEFNRFQNIEPHYREFRKI